MGIHLDLCLMPMFGRRSLGVAGAVILPWAAAAQSPVVVISIVDSVSRQTISNADIIDLRSGAHTWSDPDGRVRLAWPPGGSLMIRVRQIGYVATTRELRRDSSADSLTLALQKVLYFLPPVRTTATSACAPPPDSATSQLSGVALEQIRHSAERYENFRRDYPFRAIVSRRTATFHPGRKVLRIAENRGEVLSENWGDRYRPGEVIQSTAFGFSVPLLFLETLAQPEFWRHHCFASRGVEDQSGVRLLRLDFEPAQNLKTTDWAGSVFMDSATSMLVRVDFRLAGLAKDSRVRRLEGYTTFRSPSPFFVIPDSTVAGWWKRAPANGEWGIPDVAQSLYTISIDYRRGRPPSDAPKVPAPESEPSQVRH